VATVLNNFPDCAVFYVPIIFLITNWPTFMQFKQWTQIGRKTLYWLSKVVQWLLYRPWCPCLI